MAPFNFTAIANRWIVTGNRRSRCFQLRSGQLRVDLNDTTMLHGLYGGVDGRQVNAGDRLVYGYHAIFWYLSSTANTDPNSDWHSNSHINCQMKDGFWRIFDSIITRLVGGALNSLSRTDLAQMTQQWLWWKFKVWCLSLEPVSE